MKKTFTFTALFAALGGLPAFAQERPEIIGKPMSGAMGFPHAATELARDQQWLDWLILVIITGICVLVTVLLIYAILRYNSRSNPVPARFAHNAPLEITWTVVPILILMFIGTFSLPVLFKQQEIPDGDITIKVTGNQWYWSYEYVDHDFGFDSFMLDRDELAENGYEDDEYLLATDNAVVVPVGKIVVMQVTASDVIHSWAVPSFGVKQDGVPGRLAELWFKVDDEGLYFGQCSELCGKDHAYMPITVRAVSEEEYERWLDEAQEEFAGQPRDFQVAAR